MLRDWLVHAGLSLTTHRSFVREGVVVNDQHGLWRDVKSEEVVARLRWQRITRMHYRLTMVGAPTSRAIIRSMRRLPRPASPRQTRCLKFREVFPGRQQLFSPERTLLLDGSSAYSLKEQVTVVSSSGADLTSSCAPVSLARYFISSSPMPPQRRNALSVIPLPSSATVKTRSVPVPDKRTSTRLALACLAASVIASWAT